MHPILETHAKIALAVKEQLDESSYRPRIEALVDGVIYAYEMAVEGDVVEFGTMSGNTGVALAYAVDAKNRIFKGDVRGTKRLWFFDSFEGLPPVTNDIDRNSHHVSTGLWNPGGCKVLDEQSFRIVIANYIGSEDVSIVKGWYKDTIPAVPSDQKFSVIHLDCDLYESTIDVLDNLLKNRQISRGAILLFDDWDCNAADPDRGQRRAWSECISRYNVNFSDHGPYGWSGHKLIVHSYD